MEYIVVTEDWALVESNSNVVYQVVGSIPVEIGISSESSAPVSGIVYQPLEGDRGAIEDIFPGQSGNCLWARSSASANSAISI